MNKFIFVCREVHESATVTQRQLAARMDISLGSVNKLITECIDLGYIYREHNKLYLTDEGSRLMQPYKVDKAIILAAGFGSRFVPLTFETPKGLLEVFGERMIERQIKQLHEAGIYDITIVVGYLKEKFEYLIDKYNVTLLYNAEYSSKNTLASLWHAKKILLNHNCYILSSDNWLRDNMYHEYEPGAWYSSIYIEGPTKEWCINTNKKGYITSVDVGGADSWIMYGPVYMSREFNEQFVPALDKYYHTLGTEQFYWEQLYTDWLSGSSHLGSSLAPLMSINKQPDNQVYEFENLEELRIFDTKYNTTSNNIALELISKVFNIEESSITQIRCLKAGMTNKSFLFNVSGKPYICRIPGEGTSKLISRPHEYETYEALRSFKITETVVYFDQETGYKISEYYPNSRNPDSNNMADMALCMTLLKKLHDSSIKVSHCFDISERIDFYEELCIQNGGIPFEDYSIVRTQMDELLDMLNKLDRPKVLSHIDSVTDNFLILKEETGRDKALLIDWEYAGMADPLIDVAMCAIYSYYSKEETQKLIEMYLGRVPTRDEQNIVWAYMALGGLLWTLWAVYKSELGVEFGEYTLIMYRYAKEYYKNVKNN